MGFPTTFLATISSPQISFFRILLLTASNNVILWFCFLPHGLMNALWYIYGMPYTPNQFPKEYKQGVIKEELWLFYAET